MLMGNLYSLDRLVFETRLLLNLEQAQQVQAKERFLPFTAN